MLQVIEERPADFFAALMPLVMGWETLCFLRPSIHRPYSQPFLTLAWLQNHPKDLRPPQLAWALNDDQKWTFTWQLSRPALQLVRWGVSLAVPTLIEREQIYGIYRLSDPSDGFSLDSMHWKISRLGPLKLRTSKGLFKTLCYWGPLQVGCKCFH